MKVRLIKSQSIEGFALNHSHSRSSFIIWMNTLKIADWKTPADIQQTFASADLLGNGSKRVVFDIGGNKFRIICKYSFGETQVHLYVKWIGTHAAYTALCRSGKQYSAEQF